MSDNVIMAVGARIRDLRRASGLTQSELAARAGMSANFYGRVERGNQNLSLSTMTRIALALGMGLERLVEGLDLTALSGRDNPDTDRRARARGAAARVAGHQKKRD